jgi:hypothetical protein
LSATGAPVAWVMPLFSATVCLHVVQTGAPHDDRDTRRA